MDSSSDDNLTLDNDAKDSTEFSEFFLLFGVLGSFKIQELWDRFRHNPMIMWFIEGVRSWVWEWYMNITPITEVVPWIRDLWNRIMNDGDADRR